MGNGILCDYLFPYCHLVATYLLYLIFVCIHAYRARFSSSLSIKAKYQQADKSSGWSTSIQIWCKSHSSQSREHRWFTLLVIFKSVNWWWWYMRLPCLYLIKAVDAIRQEIFEDNKVYCMLLLIFIPAFTTS